MMNGFTLILGDDPVGAGDEGGGEDREAAKAALRRFRETKDDGEALDAFRTLVNYCSSCADTGGGDGY